MPSHLRLVCAGREKSQIERVAVLLVADIANRTMRQMRLQIWSCISAVVLDVPESRPLLETALLEP